MQIHLTGDQSFTDILRQSLRDRLSKRYKLRYMAEDMGVSYIQLYRFTKGEKVTEDFINKAVKFLIS